MFLRLLCSYVLKIWPVRFQGNVQDLGSIKEVRLFYPSPFFLAASENSQILAGILAVIVDLGWKSCMVE